MIRRRRRCGSKARSCRLYGSASLARLRLVLHVGLVFSARSTLYICNLAVTSYLALPVKYSLTSVQCPEPCLWPQVY